MKGLGAPFAHKFIHAAALAAVLGAAAPLGGLARKLAPVTYTATSGRGGGTTRLAGNWPGKRFAGNGPREVARRQRQIARGQLAPIHRTSVPAHATEFAQEAA